MSASSCFTASPFESAVSRSFSHVRVLTAVDSSQLHTASRDMLLTRASYLVPVNWG